MMLFYRELCQRRDDKNALVELSENKKKIEPLVQANNPSYFKKMLKHFMLELATVEALFKCRERSIVQDVTMATLSLNTSYQNLVIRYKNFFEADSKQICDLHNMYNNLWKWILNQ